MTQTQNSIRTHATKRDLAETLAYTLRNLGQRGLDCAVGLDAGGSVGYCPEGGRGLAVVLVQQSTDVESYGGGEMTPDDIMAIADAFETNWLDDYNARVVGTDAPQIEWAPSACEYAKRSAADVLERLCPGGEPVDGVTADQDWERETTRLTFADGSVLLLRGTSSEAQQLPAGRLCDYDTGEDLREATPEECQASAEAAERDGAGVIVVDGRKRYVQPYAL